MTAAARTGSKIRSHVPFTLILRGMRNTPRALRCTRGTNL
jgi:hypothetical protein